jgi:PKD repeat protein/nitrous oxidase accessory protein NosD
LTSPEVDSVAGASPAHRDSYTLHPSIVINSNADIYDQASQDGWPGNGSEENPFIIEGYEFDDNETRDLIEIEFTSLHIVVRNNYFHSPPDRTNYGIRTYETSNITITDNLFKDLNGRCVYVGHGTNISVTINRFVNETTEDGPDGVVLMVAEGCTIEGNSFIGMRRAIVVGGSGHLVDNNTIESSSDVSILVQATDVVLSNNTISIEPMYYYFGAWAKPYEKPALRGVVLRGRPASTIKLSSNNFYGTGVALDIDGFDDLYGFDIDMTNKINGSSIAYLINRSGESISGDYGQVFLVNCDNISIAHQTFPNQFLGIIAYDCDDVNIRDVTIRSEVENQILLQGDRCSIVESDLSNTTIKIIGDGYRVKYNEITRASWGANIDGDDGEIWYNTIHTDVRIGLRLVTAKASIIGNNLGSFYIDIYVTSRGELVVHNNTMETAGVIIDGPYQDIRIDRTNTVDGRPVLYYSFQEGFEVEDGAGQVILANCSNFIMRGIDIQGSNRPLSIVGCINGTVKDCAFDRPTLIGIYARDSIDLAFVNVTVNQGEGIHIYSSSKIRIRQCTLLDSGTNNPSSRSLKQALLFARIDDIVIEGNSIIGTAGIGLWAGMLTDAVIRNNLIKECDDFAMVILTRTEVEIHSNNIIDNLLDPSRGEIGGAQCECDSEDATWDSNGVGNYWSDYTYHHPNATNDGRIWDEPYSMDGDVVSEDLYPLVHPLEFNPPHAVAGEDVTIGIGTTLIFDGSNSTDDTAIAEYIWTFMYGGFPHKSTGAHPIMTFGIPGVYRIVLRVVDTSGNWDEVIWTVTVADDVPPTAVAGPDIVVPLGDTVDFDGSGSWDNLAVVNWTWTFEYNGSTVNLYGVNASHRFDLPGEYVVTLTVSDEPGFDDSVTFTVSVVDGRPPVWRYPTWKLGGPVLGRPTMTVEWSMWTDDDPLFPQGGYFTWEFTQGDYYITETGTNRTILFPQEGTWDAVFQARDRAGNSETFTFTLAIDIDTPTVQPPMADAGPDAIVEFMTPINLSGTFVQGTLEVVNHTWIVPTDPISYIQGLEAQYLPETMGVWTFTLIVRDLEGNVGTDVVNVSVVPRPPVIHLLQDIERELLFGVLDVTGTATSDAEITEVGFRIDDGEWQLAVGTSEWRIRLNTTLLTNDPHSLDIRVWDGYSFTTTGPIPFSVWNDKVPDNGPQNDDDEPSLLLPILGMIGVVAIVAVLVFIVLRRLR